MEFNKEENEFYKIDYSNKVIFYDNEVPDTFSDDFLRVNLSNETLRDLICERYKITSLPSILYYGSVLKVNEDAKKRMIEIDDRKEDILYNKVTEIIRANRIVMFIKGSLRSPYCQFSRELVKIIKSYVSDVNLITYYDVLMNEEMRDYIKRYSNWPTFPQLYVNNEFIGGSDIVKTMEKTGELVKVLNN